MSLVNEALKKARLEAAQRQMQAQLPSPPMPDPLPVRSGMRAPRKAFTISLIFAGLAAVFSVTLLHVEHQFHHPVSFMPSAEATPVSHRTASVQPRVSLSAPPPTVAASVTPAADQSKCPSATAGTVALSESRQPAAGDETKQDDPSYVTATQSFQPVPPGLVEGRVYIQSVDVPGVPKLNLAGILWSEKNPVAMINGISAAPGDDLNDVIVVGIEPKRVKLRAQGKEFYLRLP